jgi:TLC domain
MKHTHAQFSISFLVSSLTTTATTTITSSTWETVRRSSQQATLIVVPADANNPRLHAAPRYATAAFQCLYSAFSLATAWFCFSHSNIWPPAVFGNGATKNCWNLKGSLGMAEDFDGLDALLKLYYLLQASYHVHSGAFHILTMVLLWSRRKQHPIENKNNDKSDNGGPQEEEEQQQPKQQHKQKQQLVGTAKPFTAYWRSLLQHCIALLLIGGSHLFASTRRLGAIGNFALDASSLALHILQLCINAAPIHNNNDEKMRMRSTRDRKGNNSNYSPQLLYIKILHRGIVIPLFVYCRFYVWPFVVWRSAMFESKEWLQQMESTLFPGIYRAMLYVFTGLVIILLGLNLVLFRRLVHHPHLQRVYDNGNNGNNNNNNNTNANAKKNKNDKYNSTKNDVRKSSILSSTQQQQQQHQQHSHDLEFRLNLACGKDSHAVSPFVATTTPDQFAR